VNSEAAFLRKSIVVGGVGWGWEGMDGGVCGMVMVMLSEARRRGLWEGGVGFLYTSLSPSVGMVRSTGYRSTSRTHVLT